MMLRITTEVSLMTKKDTLASMRPQHDAADNAATRAAYPGSTRASMRPQHDAADNNNTMMVGTLNGNMLQ